MPVITVKGLGKVKIAGDTPTEDERRAMLAEIERLKDVSQPEPPQQAEITAEEAGYTPTMDEEAFFTEGPSAATIEAISPLAGLQERFQRLEAPAGREFWGDYEHPLQSEFVRPLAAGVSALPRGVLKGALAGAEVVAGRPYAPELVELEQSWADWERGLTKGAKPEDDDIYAVLGKASEGEVTPLLSLMTRGMVQATPGMIAAVQSMPAYMGTLIGDYAERAAAERGSDSIEFNDLGRAIALAGAVAGTERASALKALSGAGASTVKGAVARGALIEGGEEYAQQHLENIAMQAGSDRPGFLGVDWEEGHKGGIHGAFVGGPMGALAGFGGAVSRRPPAEPTPTIEPTPVVEEVTEEVATPTEEAVAEPAPQDAPPVDAVDAIIESIDESTAPGEFTQFGPMAVPMDAGPEVEAIDVMMETQGLVESIDVLKSRVKAEGRAAKKVVPKRPGAKEVKRKPTRAENQIAEAEGRARAALAVADVTAADSDIDDALADAVAAQARTLAGPSEFISAKNADVESLLRDMGRSDEDIKALSETQKVSYAQSLARLEDAGLRSRIEGDGQDLAVVIPPAMTALANSINQRPRAASDVEQLAFTSVIAQVNTANRRLSARINELDQIEPESSVEKSAIQDEIDILTKKKEDLDADFDLFVAANKAIGSIWGRAGWMRQRRINDNMTLDEAQGAARAKKGAALTTEQKDLLKSIFNDADALRDAATKARKGALGDYNKAKRALEKAQGVKKSADDVRNAARKKVEKAMDKRSPRQKAAEEEIRWGVDKPIRVTPLRMSAEEKAARKAFRDAQKKAKEAAKEVAKKEKKVQEIKGMVAQAEADIRRAKQKKAAAPEEAIQHPFFRHWTRQKSIARAMTSSGDDSALGRQGGALVLQNPAAAIRALPYIVRVNPFKWDPVSRRVVHNPASRAAAVEIQEEMLNSPWQTARNWAGLEMSEVEGRSNTDKSGLDAKEEYFATHAFDEGGKLLQGAGKYLITPSQNLFGLTLNRLRSVNFDEGLRILAEGEGADLDAVTPEAGDAVITAMIEANAPPSKPRRLREGDEDLFLTKEDIPSLTPEERAEFGRIDLAMNVVPRADAEALAVIINASSGRGEWTFGVSDRKGVDVVNKVLRNILFAPKFTASRFESFSHPFQLMAASSGRGRFKNVSPKALKLFRKRVRRSIGLGVGLGAMSVIAASLDDDRDPGEALDNFVNPGSADFMKGRIGNHRFDALGGIPSTIRYLLPFTFAPIEAWRKSDNPAEWAYHTLVSGLGEGAGDKFSRMVRNKLDPLTSAAWTILTQKDYLGRPLREQDFMGMPASEMDDVENFIINGLIRPVMGAYTPIMAQSASEAAIRTMYPHIGEEERNAFVHQFAPLLWEVLGGGHADYPDVKGSRGYKARSRRARKPRRPSTPRMGRYSR